jgi:SAM-dependent methyltransferase
MRKTPVAAALNAWRRWLQLRRMAREERRQGQRLAPDGLPMPPPALRQRVHGRAEPDGFLAAGERLAMAVLGTLEELPAKLPADARVLDFGCGSGRLLRHLLRLRPAWRITGTDIDAEAIAWCRSAYPGADFMVNGSDPPIDLAAGSLDLIVGFSVFTHLDAGPQAAWLSELARLLRPGGWAVLSVLGADDAARLPSADRARLRRDGFVFHRRSVGGLGMDLLPRLYHYRTAWHTREYVERTWSEWFTIAAYRPAGANDHQDMVVVQRPG